MKTSLFTLLGGASSALAAVRGFNYGAQEQNQASFEAAFKAAANLQGADDYTGARLYTMIEHGTTSDVISAIPAAIDTKTTLLLGLWASSPQDTFNNEITALKAAIAQYGSDLKELVTGISVGSEDLYRISVTGLANDPDGVGQTPDTLISYISQVRDVLKDTPLSGVPVGHVDTWNAYVNGSNSKLIEACDWLGLDEYPYFQTTDPNDISNAQKLFFEAYDKVTAVAGGKPLWITEAGWPVSGPVSGEATASVENAEIFWQDVACALEKKNINFWWYILEENATPSFSVSKGGQPLPNLACNATSGIIHQNSSSSSSNSTSSSGSSSSNSTSSGNGSSSSGSASGSSGAEGSGQGSGSSTSGNGASGTSGSSTSTSSDFPGAAAKVEAGAMGLLVTAVFAALLL